jgi:hypothetical protein
LAFKPDFHSIQGFAARKNIFRARRFCNFEIATDNESSAENDTIASGLV